jgi:oxygen-independent coproporphyrinogen-3 oxidase
MVFGAGCGAATRIITESGEIRKHYKFKYPYEYIGRFDEIIGRFQ